MIKSLLALLLLGLGTGLVPAPQEPAAVTFVAYDVFVDSGARPLGAYQFEWLVHGGMASIVGVEGGDAKAFAEAPYYDAKALQGGRIVIAAFSTSSELPQGRTRVARVHLRIEGPAPQFAVQLQACADGQGAALDAAIAWQKKESK